MDLTSNNKITSIVDNLFMEQLFGEDASLRFLNPKPNMRFLQPSLTDKRSVWKKFIPI